MSLASSRNIWLIGAFIAFCVALGIWRFGERDRVAPDAAKPTRPADAGCAADLQCAGKRNVAAASANCKHDIEELAGYGVRWTDTAHREPRFDRFNWHDRDRGTITFIGDQAEFETASGAYQPVIYECDFDPAVNKALAARVRQGHLP